MTKCERDLISISGAPSSWRLRQIIGQLIEGLRKGRWISSKCRAVLSVSCISAQQMSKLNERYRGKDQPTDVLSFEQGANSPPGIIFLGDVVLCPEVIRLQAREFGHSIQIETLILVAHGLLHLLGYDHEGSATQARRMQLAETRLLKLSGCAVAVQNAGLVARGTLRIKHG